MNQPKDRKSITESPPHGPGVNTFEDAAGLRQWSRVRAIWCPRHAITRMTGKNLRVVVIPAWLETGFMNDMGKITRCN